MTETKPRYTVRQMRSGRTGEKTYYVYDLIGKGRVSVHARVNRSAAQADADRLNAMEAQHAANLADPEWCANRDRIVAEQEANEQARTDAFERVIAAQAARRQAETTPEACGSTMFFDGKLFICARPNHVSTERCGEELSDGLEWWR